MTDKRVVILKAEGIPVGTMVVKKHDDPLEFFYGEPEITFVAGNAKLIFDLASNPEEAVTEGETEDNREEENGFFVVGGYFLRSNFADLRYEERISKMSESELGEEIRERTLHDRRIIQLSLEVEKRKNQHKENN